MSNNFKFVQAPKFSLAGSGCTASATSIIVSSFKLSDGTTDIVMTNFGTIAYATIEPGTSRMENISFTGVTQNSDGTATLTGVTRGLRFVDPYDAVSANQYPHAGGSVLVLSNSSAFYNGFVNNDDDETILGLYTFTQFPQKSGSTTPTSAAELATKAYVDATATGSAVYDQQLTSGVAGENLTAGNLCYYKTADGKWWKTTATDATTIDNVKLGIAQSTTTTGSTINFLTSGIDKNQSALTAGVTYYASNTSGAISSSAGTFTRVIGKGHPTATYLIFDPYFAPIPTGNEKTALTNLTSNTIYYGASSTGNDSYAITVTPSFAAYATGQRFRVKADVATTGAATLNVNGLGAKTIKKFVSSDLGDGDIKAGQIFEVVYDGTNMQLTSMMSNPIPTVDIQTFTTAGANTWTKPTGALRVLVELWGGGGGGGRGNSGAGGGGGEYRSFWFDASSLGSTETVTVGAGGAARGTDGTGNAGTSTTFGSKLTAASGAGGGGGGANQAGGGAGSPIAQVDNFWGSGVSAGVGQSGIYAAAGGGVNNGTGAAFAAGTSLYGGGGGGAGGTASTTTGGTSVHGGAGGNGSNGSSNGTAGTQPGGGGGGTSGSGTSGKGGDGKAIVTTFL